MNKLECSHAEIDAQNDGQLAVLIEFATGRRWNVAHALSLQNLAGRLRGWESTLVNRSGVGLPSIAAFALSPASPALWAVHHARPEIAVARAFLHAWLRFPPGENEGTWEELQAERDTKAQAPHSPPPDPLADDPADPLHNYGVRIE